MDEFLIDPAINKHPFKSSKGQFLPLGAILADGGCHFSVYSFGGYRVELCLFDQLEKEIASYPLDNKQGYLWSIFVNKIAAGQLYAYRVFGTYKPEHGLLFNDKNLLIDPYARALSKVQHNFTQSQSDTDDRFVAKSVVIDNEFDWKGTTKPTIKDDERILYELHVKGFSALNEKVPVEHRGKYLGISAPASIAHYKKLGITTLQIMPVFSFMSESRLNKINLTNYWGYNPINFFAPEQRYSLNDPVIEFKTMVRELHEQGLEVILDVVYNHTAESGFNGMVISLKGFDNKNYYSFETDPNGINYKNYSNFTGCGNSIDLDFPWSLKLVMDSLRYWVDEMQVDGFRFDLAATLARESQGFNEKCAFFKALLQDPILSKVILIAEPWDIGPGGYRLGGFPRSWLECNDKYRDTIRAFWKGEQGQIAELATRLLGSRDLFPKRYRSHRSSINYICYHDGFTLQDLVSYNSRHNNANCENNRDGHAHNLSANNGKEGATTSEQINKIRTQQKRNLVATLLLSQGTPHFLAGDEMGNTQGGNNNAYCQDNAISWINWDHDKIDKEFLEFTSDIIKLRQESTVFGKIILSDDFVNACDNSDIVKWYHPHGHLMKEQDWSSPSSQVIAVEFKGFNDITEHWFLILNSSDYNIDCIIPKLDIGSVWRVKIDSACFKTKELKLKEQTRSHLSKSIMINSNSLILLKKVRGLE